ncbi:MAG: hypothetical protein Q3983_09930 [Capnocytophaga sp.]|nr:hypothetical protein [Capnocytophaga sp.]
MKKIFLFSALLISALSFGQVKQTPLTDEEINILGSKTIGMGSGSFNYNEIKKYNLTNVIGYLVEFQYEEKTIAMAIAGIKYYINSGYSSFAMNFPKVMVYFKTSELSNDVLFTLLKENNWIIQKNEAQEEYVCPDISTNGVSLFRTEDYKTYKMNNLVDGKIKLILYKLEK